MSGRIVPVADGVHVATSRFMATNTTVLTRDGRAVVVDPGVHPDELADLADAVRALGVAPVAGVATHAHWDHVLWHPGLGDVPRFASARTVDAVNEDRLELLDQAAATTTVDRSRFGALQALPEPVAAGAGTLGGALGDPPGWGDDVEVIVHDAHAPGHLALFVRDTRVLLAGDLLSDVEVPLLSDALPGPEALSAHHEALDRLADLGAVRAVVPGHGAVCDGAGFLRRVDADRRYLDALLQAPEDAPPDPRITAQWLRDADRNMRREVGKRAWRRWVDTLAAPSRSTGEQVERGLHAWLATHAPDGLVAGYSPLPGEIDLDRALGGHRLVLPRISDDGADVTWHDASPPLEPHRFGMLQPTADAPQRATTELDVVVVPGRVFDSRGYRLGRGGGHYDRLRHRLRADCAVVGATVDERVVPRVPTEAHDQPMTHLATETGVRAL